MIKAVLFVCLGNICRSPMAEAIFRDMVERQGLGSQFLIDSAGLIDYHRGEKADDRMRSRAANRGYYITHLSRPIEVDDFNRFDIILGMDKKNCADLRNMAPCPCAAEKIGEMASYLVHHDATAVPDPCYGTSRDFDHVIDLLEDACQNLMHRLLKGAMG